MRLIVAAVLLVAAILKTHQLATLVVVPSLSESLLHARWFNIFVVEFELFFGILPRLTWLVTISLFSIFSIVSCYKAISGADSCGCLGLVTIRPQLMMTLDIGMIGLLLKFRPNQKNIENLKRVFSQYSRQIILFTGIYVLLGSTIYGWIIQRTYERLEHIGQVLESNTVQLEPEKWIGKEFPLRNYVISDQDFIHGHWKVLLSRPGCNVCENVKQKFADDKSFMTISLSDKNIHNKMTFQLTPNVHWIANTPILIILENGVVKNVQIREQLLSAMETHLF